MQSSRRWWTPSRVGWIVFIVQEKLKNAILRVSPSLSGKKCVAFSNWRTLSSTFRCGRHTHHRRSVRAAQQSLQVHSGYEPGKGCFTVANWSRRLIFYLTRISGASYFQEIFYCLEVWHLPSSKCLSRWDQHCDLNCILTCQNHCNSQKK